MPCSSIHYSVARIKVLEKKIIDKDRVDRMLSADNASKAFKVLLDSGYGKVPVEHPWEFESMIKDEMNDAYHLIQKITPDEELSDVFILKYDYQNAKAYLKMKMSGIDEPAAITDAGKFDVEELKEMVFEHDIYGLPDHLAKAIDEAIKQTTLEPSPQIIDTILDQAYMSWAINLAKKKNNKFLKEYFLAKVDLSNILTMLRVRKMHAEFDLVKSSFIKGGLIDFVIFQRAYEQADEAVPKYFKNTSYGLRLERKIEEALNKNSIWIFGKFVDNYLSKIVSKYSREIFSVEPVVGYLLAKENEARTIRLVMTGKLNNMSQDVIRERLREIYV